MNDLYAELWNWFVRENTTALTAVGAILGYVVIRLVAKVGYHLFSRDGQQLNLTLVGNSLLDLLTLPTADKQWVLGERTMCYGAIKLYMTGPGSFDVRVEGSSIWWDLTRDDVRSVKQAAYLLWNKLHENEEMKRLDRVQRTIDNTVDTAVSQARAEDERRLEERRLRAAAIMKKAKDAEAQQQVPVYAGAGAPPTDKNEQALDQAELALAAAKMRRQAQAAQKKAG